RLSGTWLLVTAQGGTADAVAGTLRRHGADVVVVETSPDGTPEADTALTGRLTEALAAHPAAGVLSLLALDGQAGDETAAHPALRPTVALAAALEESGGATPLWIATRGAVAARRGHAEPRPEQAQFWGLG
ncbi:hypothetical protein AB4Z54_72265, partial [Streptomyces sp. MCAF7]